MAFASRPAWVSTPAVRAAVDKFYSSAPASVRRASASGCSSRCPRTSGRPPLLRRHWLCSIRRRTPAHPSDTPCRTKHRSENSPFPSLCRATPSAASEHLVELLGSSPIFLSFAASCVSFQLRLLPSTGVTRLQRDCEPRRHPSRPGLSLTSCQLIAGAITAGTSRVVYGPLCLHSVANAAAGLMETCSLVRFRQLRPSRKPGRVGSCITHFEACSAFTRVSDCTLAKSP